MKFVNNFYLSRLRTHIKIKLQEVLLMTVKIGEIKEVI